MAEIKKGDIVKIKLDNLAHGGECVGRIDGLAVFVPEGVPGEEVEIEIIEKKKNYARGRIKNILEKGKGRVKPSCAVYTDCGGCHLQQMDYQSQLKHKRKIVVDVMERIGGLDNVIIKPVIGSDYPYAYRNKAQFPLARNEEGKIITGFYRKGTHEVIPNNDCLIQHPLINRVMNRTLEVINDYELSVYNEEKHKGLLRHVVIRVGTCTNQALLIFVTRESDFPYKDEIAGRIMEAIPELTGVLQNVNTARTNVILGKRTEIIKGEGYLIDYIGDIKFAISPESFFQVNTLQTRELYDVIKNYSALSGKETILDAYCGIGSIALYLARGVREVYGIEEVERAIEDARENAFLNNITNCRFQTGRVEVVLPQLVNEGLKPDLIVFDPPRKGLDQEVINTVLMENIDKIIYVSCNPATLARDLANLKEKYKIVEVQPVDMFPQTYHVETVVLLELNKKK